MSKKKGSKGLLAVAALLVIGLLFAGVIPVMASGNGWGNGRGAGNAAVIGNNNSLADIVSNTLGISRFDLAQERQAGKSLLDIAAEKGVAEDQLITSLMEQRQQRLDQALQDQKITQQQYDQCLQTMRNNLESNLSRTATGPNGMGAGQGAGKSMGNGTGRCQHYCRW